MPIPQKERKLEILLVVLTGLLKFVLMDWLNLRIFYITAAILFWAGYVYFKRKKYPDIMSEWGFHKAYFLKSMIVILPFALATLVGILVYGYLNHAEFLNWHVIPVLALYPLWGLIQQFMMVGLVAGNLEKLKDMRTTNFQIILLSSFVFAMVHYPSLPLMGYAFVMEIIFVRVYLKWPNLWTLGIYHGIISALFIFFVLGRDLWAELWTVFS